MLRLPGGIDRIRVVVLNSKGGCGKTTLATNLASYYAVRGRQTSLMDCDPQESSMRWLRSRPADRARIHGIAACNTHMRATLSWQLRVPDDTTRLIVDSAAGPDRDRLLQLTRDADKILIPVLPSSLDIHAASRCIADLLLTAKIDRRDDRLGVVANRTRQNNRIYKKLMRFLETLGIPIVGVLRDTQNYVSATERGIGIHEMKPYRVAKDLPAWDALAGWIDNVRYRPRPCHPPREARAVAAVT